MISLSEPCPDTDSGKGEKISNNEPILLGKGETFFSSCLMLVPNTGVPQILRALPVTQMIEYSFSLYFLKQNPD